jgi:hypothetical protein
MIRRSRWRANSRSPASPSMRISRPADGHSRPTYQFGRWTSRRDMPDGLHLVASREQSSLPRRFSGRVARNDANGASPAPPLDKNCRGAVVATFPSMILVRATRPVAQERALKPTFGCDAAGRAASAHLITVSCIDLHKEVQRRRHRLTYLIVSTVMRLTTSLVSVGQLLALDKRMGTPTSPLPLR